MKLLSIASGSSGNCIYVGSQNTNILVDVGISAKKIEEGLLGIGVAPKNIHAVLITHEHSDHIGGLGVLLRRYHIPVYATAETLNSIYKNIGNGGTNDELLNSIKADCGFNIGDIYIEPFSVKHDASNPVCYTFMSNGQKIGMATDLGKYDEYIISKLSGSEVLYIEANHDVNMLLVGKYPYRLKQRILGDYGHLSNESSAGLICKLLHNGLRSILLAHLSKDNNISELAYETVRVEVMKSIQNGGLVPDIVVARRDIPSDLIVI